MQVLRPGHAFTMLLPQPAAAKGKLCAFFFCPALSSAGGRLPEPKACVAELESCPTAACRGCFHEGCLPPRVLRHAFRGGCHARAARRLQAFSSLSCQGRHVGASFLLLPPLSRRHARAECCRHKVSLARDQMRPRLSHDERHSHKPSCVCCFQPRDGHAEGHTKLLASRFRGQCLLPAPL